MKINILYTFKRLFILSLIWIIIEGIFRKWLFPNLTGPIFYIKYILLLLCYITLLTSNLKIPPPRQLYHFLISTFVIICFFGLFNNRNNNPIIVGLIGLIVHLMFLPIIHLNQYLFDSLAKIQKLGKILVYLSFPICILGAIQFYLPVDHPLNGFANEEQLIARAAGYTRISSIFSFMKIYNAYLLFNITFLTGILLNKLLKNEPILLYVISLILLIVNMFMTGSRLPIILMVINIVLISMFSFISYSSLRKTVFVTFIFGAITISTLYLTTNFVKDPIDAAVGRFEKAESRHRSESTGFTDVQLRIEDRLDIFKFAQEAGFFGYGIGMTYQGSKSIIKNPIPFYFEEEGERLVLELGIIGGLIIIAMRLTIFIFAFGILRWCKTVEIKLILLSLLLLIIPPILTIQMTTFSYMENFFYYFTIGLIIALYKIHLKEKELEYTK